VDAVDAQRPVNVVDGSPAFHEDAAPSAGGLWHFNSPLAISLDDGPHGLLLDQRGAAPFLQFLGGLRADGGL
jgi:hypothetical protein